MANFRNMDASLKKAMAKYWNKKNVSNVELGPHLINNEYMTAINAAGTGLVDIAKVDANNLVQINQFSTEVTVSTAEVLALNATPKTLVAAPGAGKLLVFMGAIIALDYNSAAYAGIAAGEDLAIKYTDGSGVIASTTLETTGFLDQTSDQIRTIRPLATDITPVANAPLVLHLLTGEITTGNSPLKLTVFYRIVATGL